MTSLGRVGHFDLPGENGFVGIAPVKAEIMTSLGSVDVFFYGRTTEWQLRVLIEVLCNPAGNFRGECTFVYWHVF